MVRQSSALLLTFVLVFTISPISHAEIDEEIPEWGIYVYMAGDNSLYEEVDDDLNEMKMVGSNENLEIVALTDQVPQGDSHAYHVVKHGLEETPLSQINSTWGDELDMGNGDTLRDFMIWATTEYPAQKKILVIWNHGSGWEKVAEDRESYLTVPEIRTSIEQYREQTGDSKLTMIGFDACLMGMFEIAYELKDQAEMIHGSEAYEPLEGWTYNHLLYKLKENLTNSELAYHVVNDYVESYRNGSVYTSYSVTAAVIDTSKLQNLWNHLENFSLELKHILPVYHEEIQDSRAITQRYDQNPNYRDLHDLATNIRNNIPMADTREYAEELQHSIDEAVIAEDHWQKPEKREVDRAHGLTIYFPDEGIKSGYDDLSIKENSWYDFIQQYNIGKTPNGFFNTVNSVSVDTGTGYNDSVLINGTYSGNADVIKIRLINSDKIVVNTYEGSIADGNIPDIYLQPTKSGNYSLEIGIYGNDGFLEDHYINENLFINLQLPDLYVEKPVIHISADDGRMYEVQHIQTNDNFSIIGKIKNIGTIDSNNVSVLVNDNGIERTFYFDKIQPQENKEWEIVVNEAVAGTYSLNIQVNSTDPFEIDSENNFTTHSFEVFEPINHQYTVNLQNKNILEIQSEDNDYSFPWLESYILLENNKLQSWDEIKIVPELIDGWEFEAEDILHLSEESSTLIKIKPPINTETGDYRIKLNLVDRNGFEAGDGLLTVNVPQYYGVGIRAENNDGEISIFVQNNGNGIDTFRLEKNLDEGLELYVTESYFELDAFEEITIKTVGLQTNESKKYTAEFSVESIGNENITAEVSLVIEGQTDKNEERNNYFSIIFAIFGCIGISYLIYQRRIE